MKTKKNKNKELSLSPLRITAKPLHTHSASETKYKLRKGSIDLPSHPNLFYQIDKSFFNLHQIQASNLQRKCHKKNSFKSPLNFSLLKPATNETSELDSSVKIFKCMSNPNVNGNSSAFRNSLRDSTGLTDTLVRRVSTTKNLIAPKLKRLKVKSRQDSLSINLQKSNGIVCKEDENILYKYYVGPGNNSALIVRVMKTRPKWKRTYSFIGANFSWTALKNYSIFDSLNSCAQEEQRALVQAKNCAPEVIPDQLYWHIAPAKHLQCGKQKLYNKLLENRELTSKKRLFYNMQSYYLNRGINPFTKIPLTFHLIYGSYDTSFKVFVSKFLEFQKEGKSNIWIVKPGERTNRGIGISVCSTMAKIIEAINDYESEYERTFILQKYIDNPFLYNGRKFDIRVYAVVSCIQGNIQAYFYKEGYLRTSGVDFDLNDVENSFVHLTNDAIQKHDTNYGKHEAGNKLSYLEFQNYLDLNHPTLNFFSQALPQIKDLVTDTVQAAYQKLDPEKKLHCFEVLGYDFMLDNDFQVWLIEVNTNPCLELSSPYLSVLIPKMIENAFSLTVDQLFPHNSSIPNDFEMIFNESIYQKTLQINNNK